MICVIFFLNFLNSLAANAKKISFLEKLQQPDKMDDSEEFKTATEIFPQLDAYNTFFEDITSNRIILFREQLVDNKKFFKALFVNESFKIIPGEKIKLYSISEDFVINKEILKSSEYYDIFYSKIIDQSNILNKIIRKCFSYIRFIRN